MMYIVKFCIDLMQGVKCNYNSKSSKNVYFHYYVRKVNILIYKSKYN